MRMVREKHKPTLWRCAALAAVLGGCQGKDPVGPNLSVTARVNLAPSESQILSGDDIAGLLRFPVAGGTGAQYLIVGQFASGVPDVQAAVKIQVNPAGPDSGALLVAEPPAPAPPSAAQRFHDMLRSREAAFGRANMLAQAGAPAPRPSAVRATQPPPAVGSKRTFKVCADLSCNALANVPATARYVGGHAAIFLEDTLPANGFDDADLAALGAQFDQVLYPIDVAAFGAESDIDANGVIIILLSKRINALVPEPDCRSAFVTGFFYGADLAPGLAAQHNNGEVFYGFVPDPSGTVSCPYTKDFIKRILPVTFVHEFQHMISFNEHVLVRNQFSETLWLNEGLSHIAEELGGNHYDSLGDNVTASRFYIGDLYNAFTYLKQPHASAMVSDSPPGSLESRGAAWLFVRYLADQFGQGILRQLVQTSRTGELNVAFATGQPFPSLLSRWALAVFVSDLPGFTAPAPLTYSSWSFRDIYQQLHASQPATFDRDYPLFPASGGSSGAFSLTGTLASGSGAYVLVTQLGGGPGFDVSFRTSSGGVLPGNADAQLTVLRLR